MGGRKPIGVDPSRGNCRSRRGRRQNLASLITFNSSNQSTSSSSMIENNFSLFSSIWILDPSSVHKDNNVIANDDSNMINGDQTVKTYDNDYSKLEFIGTDFYPGYEESSSSSHNNNLTSEKSLGQSGYIDEKSHLNELTTRVAELTLLVDKLQSKISQMTQIQVAHTDAAVSVNPSLFPVTAELAPIGPPSRSLSKSPSAASIAQTPFKSPMTSHPSNTLSQQVSPSSSVGSDLHQLQNINPHQQLQSQPVIASIVPTGTMNTEIVNPISSAEWTKVLDRISTLEGRQAFVQSKISQLDVAFDGAKSASWRKATKKLQNILSNDAITNATINKEDNINISAQSCDRNDNQSNQLATDVCLSQEDTALNTVSYDGVGDTKKKSKKNKKQSKTLVTQEGSQTSVSVSQASDSTILMNGNNSNTPSTTVSTIPTQTHGQEQGKGVVSGNQVNSPNRAKARDIPWNGSNSVRRWHRNDQDSSIHNTTTGNSYDMMYMSSSPIFYYYPQYASGVPLNQYPYPSYPYMYSMTPDYQHQPEQQEQSEQEDK